MIVLRDVHLHIGIDSALKEFKIGSALSEVVHMDDLMVIDCGNGVQGPR